MESSYGIGINNRYALFLDAEDADPEVLQQSLANQNDGKRAAAVADQKTKVNGATLPTKKDASKKPANAKDAKSINNNREDKENRNNVDKRKQGNQDRENRNNQRNRGGEGNGTVERSETDARRGRGGARGGRGGRGAGGRGGKRDFDRKSGDDKTGVKPVEKRDGTGSHNWGTFKDDMQAEHDTANSDEAHNDSNAAENAGDYGDKTDEEPREEEPKTFTLSEWKAQQQGTVQAPKFNTRKAGEGADLDPKWKKTYAYKKERETNEDDDDEEDAEYYPQRPKPKKVLDIDFTFTDPNRPARGGRGGPRGGRGGPRGDRGDRPDRRGGDRDSRGPTRGDKRGPRGGRGGATAPDFGDDKSFPALG